MSRRSKFTGMNILRSLLEPKAEPRGAGLQARMRPTPLGLADIARMLGHTDRNAMMRHYARRTRGEERS